MQANPTFAYGFFRDEQAAAAAVQKLVDAKFDTEHIGVLMREGGQTKEAKLDHKTGVGPGAIIGSALGIAAGAIALPVSGVIALGGAFAAIGGAAVGGATGTLMGVLGGLGLWKDEADVPDAALQKGVLVGAVTPPERADGARAALLEAGAQDTAFATWAEAKRDLAGKTAALTQERNVSPDNLARKIFLLTLAYVFAVAGSIWLFIRPV